MKKIPSLFERDYEGTRQVYDVVVEGCEWVIDGEGLATEQFDGTACMVRRGQLYRRYDRKKKKGKYKDAPDGWISCEEKPDENTGHWPGWVMVCDEYPETQYAEAMERFGYLEKTHPDGTYELVGPKVQGNPYKLDRHALWKHDASHIEYEFSLYTRTFESIKCFLENTEVEGIVWHHPDGRMCKIKRRDFGIPWPVQREGQDACSKKL